MAQTRVYVTQFDCWWSATQDQWVAICKAAVTAGGAYDLSGLRALKGKPASIRSIDGGYFAATPNTTVVRPLNWEVSDFLREANI